MRRVLLVVAFIAPLFSLSCGRPYENNLKEGFTRVIMGGGSSSGLRPHVAPTTEAMVFATNASDKSKTGRRYFTTASQLENGGADSVKTWDIPNGSYKFAMVGYSDFSMGVNNSAVPICAEGSPEGGVAGDTVVLNGGTERITFTGAACPSGGSFKESANYADIFIRFCANNEDLSDLGAHGAGGGVFCTNPLPGSTIRSIKVMLTEGRTEDFFGIDFFNIDHSGGAKIVGGCMPLGGTGNITQNLKYVGGNQGGSGAMIKTEIAAYTSTDCGVGDGGISFYGMYLFPKGFSEANGTGSTTIFTQLGAIGNFTGGGANALWVDDGSNPPKLWLRKLD